VLFTDRGAGPVPSADLVPAGEERVLPAPPPDEATSAATSPEPPPAGAPGSAAPGSAPRPVTAGLDGGAALAALTAGPPAAGKPFTVHVASFRSEEKVAPIVRGLRHRGAAAWFEPAADAPGWYRVFVGRFATEDEALVHAAFLLENQWVDRANVYSTPAR
jgi:cell division septation protein DedD